MAITEDKINEIDAELAMLSQPEKWKLVEESFGMWADYPADWLDRLRSGKANHQDHPKPARGGA